MNMHPSQLENSGRAEIHAFAEKVAAALEKVGCAVRLEYSGSAFGASVYLDVIDPLGSPLSKQVRVSGHRKSGWQSSLVIDINSDAALVELIAAINARCTPEKQAWMQEVLARQQAREEAEEAAWLQRQIEKEANALARADAKAATGEKLSRLESNAVKARAAGCLVRDGGKIYW
jgi:hypothetical protein